jgi:hypothetical protein
MVRIDGRELELKRLERNHFELRTVDLNIGVGDFKLNEISGRFEGTFGEKGSASFDGPWTSSRFEWKDALCEQVEARLQIERFQTDSFSARVDLLDLLCYGGSLSGDILFLGPPLETQGRLQVERVALHKLAEDVAGLQDRFEGDVSGSIRFTRRAQSPLDLHAILTAPEGGKIQANLLQHLVASLPEKSETFQIVQQLAARGEMVFCDDIDLEIESTGEQELRVKIDMLSRKLNLRPDITLDVSLDANMARLFGLMPSFK